MIRPVARDQGHLLTPAHAPGGGCPCLCPGHRLCLQPVPCWEMGFPTRPHFPSQALRVPDPASLSPALTFRSNSLAHLQSLQLAGPHSLATLPWPHSLGPITRDPPRLGAWLGTVRSPD